MIQVFVQTEGLNTLASQLIFSKKESAFGRMTYPTLYYTSIYVTQSAIHNYAASNGMLTVQSSIVLYVCPQRDSM